MRRFIVLNHNTLGVIRADRPRWMKPIAFKPGGYNPAKGDAVMSPRDDIRDATTQDFFDFGVDPRDYLWLGG